MSQPEKTIAVLGVGSILLTDEGLGVHAVNQIKETYSFEPEVRLLDGGTMGMELLYYIKDVTHLVLIDAMHGKESAGTVYELRRKEVERYFSGMISAHEVGMKDILDIRGLDASKSFEVTVIGVEPASLEVGLEMTDCVAQALPTVIERVIAQLGAWGVTATKR